VHHPVNQSGEREEEQQSICNVITGHFSAVALSMAALQRRLPLTYFAPISLFPASYFWTARVFTRTQFLQAND